MTAYPFYIRLFLWRSRALYFGPPVCLESHSHGAVVLHVGIYRPFNLRVGNGAWQTCRCAIVPAGIHHEFDLAGGIHGKLFIERDSADFLYFRQRFPYLEKSVSCFDDQELLCRFLWMYEQDPPRTTIEGCLDSLLHFDGRLQSTLDPRIQAVIELLHKEPDRNFSQEFLAAQANLSPSRFLHLFKEHAGVPYRRFRTWKRLFLAMENLHRVDNMTCASLDAGFADAAHFSHRFRDAFGINPAFVFRGLDRFECARQ